MSLHDDLVAGQVIRYCILCKHLKSLGPEAQAEWDVELALPTEVIGHAAVRDYLKKHHNVTIDEEAIRRHRTRKHNVTAR